MRIYILKQNKLHCYLQKLESTKQQYLLWKLNKARKGYSIFSPKSVIKEENLPWSGMDLCNVIQKEIVGEKDGFCIVGLHLDKTEPKLGYTC